MHVCMSLMCVCVYACVYVSDVCLCVPMCVCVCGVCVCSCVQGWLLDPEARTQARRAGKGAGAGRLLLGQDGGRRPCVAVTQA